MLHPRKVSFFDKAGRTSKRPASAGRFELQGHLQFLQFLASEAFLEAFACLPAFALELSLAAEACLPFALDPVFSMFTPLGDRPVFRLLPVEGSMPLRSWFYTFLVGELFPRAIFRRQAFISARSCCRIQRNINMLPSSDMGVLLSPLLRVPPKTIPPCGAPRF